MIVHCMCNKIEYISFRQPGRVASPPSKFGALDFVWLQWSAQVFAVVSDYYFYLW